MTAEAFSDSDPLNPHLGNAPQIEQIVMLNGLIERITVDAQQAAGSRMVNPDYIVPILEKGALTRAQINWLGDRIFKREISFLEPPIDDYRRSRVGRHIVIRTLTWFGESTALLHDPVTAQNTADELKSWGGIAGRRAARKVRSRI